MSANRPESQQAWRDPLFETADRVRLVEMWDRIQRTQVDLGFAQELSAFYSSKAWPSARSVLDVGTGNGYYLRKLAERFPDKSYLGIDSSKEFVAIAKAEAKQENIEFQCCDFFDVSGHFDFVILRLFLQHMRDLSAVLDNVSDLMDRDAAALVIDPYLPRRLFRPEPPELMKFLDAYNEQQAQQGLNRDAVLDLEEKIASHPKLQVADHQVLICPTTYPGMPSGSRSKENTLSNPAPRLRSRGRTDRPKPAP